MVSFNSFKTSAFRQDLKRQLQQTKTERTSRPFDDMKNIGLLFLGGNLEDQRFIEQYAESMRKKGKQVKLLAYFDNKTDYNSLGFQFFNKNDLKWNFVPHGETVRHFMETPFDLLLDVQPGGVLPLEYIASLSKAKFRIGRNTQQSDCYDLMIDTHLNKDIGYFIGQVNFFLKILNRKPNEELSPV